MRREEICEEQKYHTGSIDSLINRYSTGNGGEISTWLSKNREIIPQLLPILLEISVTLPISNRAFLRILYQYRINFTIFSGPVEQRYTLEHNDK